MFNIRPVIMFPLDMIITPGSGDGKHSPDCCRRLDAKKLDLSSQQFSPLPAAQYFQAKPPIMMFNQHISLFCKLILQIPTLPKYFSGKMLPLSSARQLAIGGSRALSYAGGKVLLPNWGLWLLDCRCLQRPKMWLVVSGWRAQLTSGLKCTTQQPTRWVEWKCR